MVIKPLSFVVDIAGALAVKAGGSTILSVTLKLTLSGPEPWHAHGKASFSILFFDVSVSFDVTFGDDPPPELPASVHVAPLLLAALHDARSWTAQLPAGSEMYVSLREVLAGPDALLAHPLGTLQVRERVVPLERTLERFGSEVPAGANRFRIGTVTLGGDTAETEPLNDLFAAAQFSALADDQKLARPSFEAMRSGVRIGEHDVAHGTPVSARVVFEQRVVPAFGEAQPSPLSVPLGADVLGTLIGAPPAPRAGPARAFATAAAPTRGPRPAVRLREPGGVL